MVTESRGIVVPADEGAARFGARISFVGFKEELTGCHPTLFHSMKHFLVDEYLVDAIPATLVLV